MSKTKQSAYPRTVHTGGSQKLAPNDVWNIPERGTDEVRLEVVTAGMWQTVKTVRGLTIDRDGTVYGIRSLTNARESGYALEGQVSIDGRKYRAFTSDVLFQREDGSLCSVGVLYARKDSLPTLPDLDTASDEFLAELSNRYFYSDKKDPRGLLYEYVRALQILREDDKKEPNRADKMRPEWREYYVKQLEYMYEALPLSMKFKGVNSDIDDQITAFVIEALSIGRKVEAFDTVQLVQDGPILCIETRHIIAAMKGRK